jgi:hypothetical protein
VCAIFSTTKAIAGTVALMLMQEGSLDMDAPAKEYAPAIGELQVLDIRMWLNDGAGPDGQILDAQTVEIAAGNHLGELKIHMLPGVIPALSNDAEFFPGMPKSWAISFMINDEEAPTGRPAGSLAWAGLANPSF